MAGEMTEEEKAEKQRNTLELMTEKARKVQINWDALPEEEQAEKHEKALKAMTAFTNRYLKVSGTKRVPAHTSTSSPYTLGASPSPRPRQSHHPACCCIALLATAAQSGCCAV